MFEVYRLRRKLGEKIQDSTSLSLPSFSFSVPVASRQFVELTAKLDSAPMRLESELT